MGLIWLLAGLTTLVVYPFIMGQIARRVDPHKYIDGLGIFLGTMPFLVVVGIVTGAVFTLPSILGVTAILGTGGMIAALGYAGAEEGWEIFLIGSFPLALPLVALWKLGQACLAAPRALYRLGRGEL